MIGLNQVKNRGGNVKRVEIEIKTKKIKNYKKFKR